MGTKPWLEYKKGIKQIDSLKALDCLRFEGSELLVE
jgi:hypothetical protein